MHSIEPLLASSPEITDLAGRIIAESHKLGRHLHPETINAVTELLQTVNCYYSNLIENHDTHPVAIEKAMAADFAPGSRERDLQLEAAAHIAVQQVIRAKLNREPDTDIFSMDFLSWIHKEFYLRMPEKLRYAVNPVTGARRMVEPGSIRDFAVKVGNHVPPSPREIHACLRRLDEVYGPRLKQPEEALSAIAAAHHRLLWVHPFGDGNGRVVRLLTDAALLAAGIEGQGLWTASRGLARNRQKYFSLLEQADSPRQNDFDGRGALSQKGLVEFCVFFLSTCLDQITFMGSLLEIDRFADRVLAYGHSREAGVLPDENGSFDRADRLRPESTRFIHELAFRGAIPRNQISDILGVEDRTSRRILQRLSVEGFIISQSSRAPVRLRIPAHAGPYLFPGLYHPL